MAVFGLSQLDLDRISRAIQFVERYMRDRTLPMATLPPPNVQIIKVYDSGDVPPNGNYQFGRIRRFNHDTGGGTWEDLNDNDVTIVNQDGKPLAPKQYLCVQIADVTLDETNYPCFAAMFVIRNSLEVITPPITCDVDGNMSYQSKFICGDFMVSDTDCAT
jgi:hypothetical protein